MGLAKLSERLEWTPAAKMSLLRHAGLFPNSCPIAGQCRNLPGRRNRGHYQPPAIRSHEIVQMPNHPLSQGDMD